MTPENSRAHSKAALRLGALGWGDQSVAFHQALGEQGTALPLFLPSENLAPEQPPAVSLQRLSSLEALFAACELIVVDVPSEQLEPLLPMIRLCIADRHVLVLLGQHWRLEHLGGHLNERKLLRCMVLPLAGGPSLVVFCATSSLSSEDLQAFEALFATQIDVMRAKNQARLDVLLGLAAMAPAGFYLLVEALADGALLLGLPPAQGRRLIATVLAHASRRVLTEDTHPAHLREETLRSSAAAAGLMELEAAGMRGLTMRAVKKAIGRLAAAPTNPFPQED